MPSSRSTIIWSMVWKLLERFSVQIVSFVVTIFLARLLLPEEYGIIALISIFIALSDVIIDGGLNMALIQKKNADNVDFSTVFYVSLALSGIVYLILYCAAPAIAKFYRSIELVSVVRVLSVSLFFYALNSIQRAYVSRRMLFRKMFICNLLAVALSGIIGISLAYIGCGVWSLVAQSVSNICFSSILMWSVVRWRPSFSFSMKRLSELFSFGWKIFVSNIIITLFVKIRALIIGRMYQPSTLAFYDKGNQFPGLISDAVCGAVQSILFPAFSEVQDDRLRIKSMMRRSINVTCFFMFPLMAGMIAVAKPLVLFLLTEKWLPCVPFLQILCASNFFRPITIPNGQAIAAMGYSGITLKLEIIRKIVDVIILVISCYIGVYAIAWGVVLFNFICLFINLIPNIRLLNYSITEQVRDVLPSFLASLLMCSIIYWITWLDIAPFLQLLIQIVLGVFVYYLFCRLFKIDSYVYLKNIAFSKLPKYWQERFRFL